MTFQRESLHQTLPPKARRSVRRRNPGPKRTLELDCDRLWQQVVLLAARGMCVHCGTRHHLSGHHLIKRSNKRFRHEPMNGVCLCFLCHNWAETHQDEFTAWLKKIMPTRWKWRTQDIKYEWNDRVSMEDLKDSKEMLSKMLEKLNARRVLGKI